MRIFCIFSLYLEFCLSRTNFLVPLIFFRFSVFLGQLLRCGHIEPNLKLNRIKIGLSVVFAQENTGFPCSILNTGSPCSILNTVKHGQITKVYFAQNTEVRVQTETVQKKVWMRIFCISRSVILFLLFKIFFRFSVFQGNYCDVGTLYSRQK